ncbi:hypothetical protein CYMTET_24018 [Cymbomonas tetramitiformis]|uniref:Oxidoreductase FAD/NAD(P)-binding domain-containing protein n=1 Tax=Cymbomonas tetramitiformis TaxID=36881 RepID=A0AAE0L0M8_9CHLO|nr:hypothetical protein CYMTET_24018 [Cymbomonas tetramitiformis]
MRCGNCVHAQGPKMSSTVYEENMYEHMVFIAGGTGVTPFMQVSRSSVTPFMQIMTQSLQFMPDDLTKFTLIFCNSNEQDVALKRDLKQLQSLSGGRMQVHFIISRKAEESFNWEGLIGRCSVELLQPLLPKLEVFVKNEAHIWICGPSGFVGNLAEQESGNSQSNVDATKPVLARMGMVPGKHYEVLTG